MKRFFFVAFAILPSLLATAQDDRDVKSPGGNNSLPVVARKPVIITGARFTYPLVQRLIDEFNVVHPDIQVVIEQRGSADPAGFDILTEVYEQDPSVKANREYVYLARYAIVPVASSASAFARHYRESGLTSSLAKQIYFNDIFSSKADEKKIKAPFTVYTRLQKAGIPIVFSRFYGFKQDDLKGKAIAGGDEHLLKAMLRDSTGVSYLPISLAYDSRTGAPVAGLAVLPLDADDNGRISDDERFYRSLGGLIERLETAEAKRIKNIPVEYLHLSVNRQDVSLDALVFLRWVNENAARYLKEYGFLQPEPNRQKANFSELARKGLH